VPTRATPDAEEIADRLHSLAIHLLRQVRRDDPKTGLSAARLSALSVVVYGNYPTVSEVAAAEQVSNATASRLVRALMADGLVEGVKDYNDGRSYRIRATRAGEKVLREGRRRRVAHLTALLKELPARDLESLDVAAVILAHVLERGRS
jgi:DNA-binding MarR family transcriptional regulator